MNMMKTTITILLIACGAFAQDMRDGWRTINSQRVDVRPLFIWWTNATSIANSNKSTALKIKIPTPAKPLAAWVRIVSEDVTNTGRFAIARAEIQSTPTNRPKGVLIVLQNYPVNEIAAIKDANIKIRQNRDARDSAQTAAQMSSAKASALNRKGTLYQEMGNVDRQFRPLANSYNRAASQNQQRADAAATRSDTLDEEHKKLIAITGGRTHFKLDNFAVATGEKYDGLPVYDLGLPTNR